MFRHGHFSQMMPKKQVYLWGMDRQNELCTAVGQQKGLYGLVLLTNHKSRS